MKIRSALLLSCCALALSRTHAQSEIRLIENPIQGFERENLGASMNSTVNDMLPVISADGKTLYISRKGHPNNFNGDIGEDVWFSTRSDSASWSAPQCMGAPINTEGNNAVLYCTPDGNRLLLLNLYGEDGKLAGGGLSVTQRTADGWEMPQKINIRNYYNDQGYAGYTFSNDLSRIILGIRRNDDTEGASDLYLSVRDSAGSWSAPLNLGKMLNTTGMEVSPFLAADGRTLYFSSDGHAGYGSYDVFMTRRLDDSWTNWSEPLNLGSEINSPGMDLYYSIPANGEYAYFASSDNSLGGTDILRIQLTEAARPAPVVLVRGRVFDNKSGLPLSATITYEDLQTGEQLGSAISNPANGEFKIVLDPGKSYGFMAQREGYMAESQNIDLRGVDEYQEVERDLRLAPIEVGARVVLNNLFFETAKAELTADSERELARLIKMLADFPNMSIEISGHTDSQGADAYNLDLSNRRAKAVTDYLVRNGVSQARLTAKGYGESKPIGDNATVEGRAKNRRVEFSITKI